MRFHKMHDDHNLLVCTPQYFKQYEIGIASQYPNHEIEISTLVSHGNCYLFNKEKLREEYETKIKEIQND